MNGEPYEPSGPPARGLLGFLRGDLGLTGTKPGCGEGECGACTVLVDGVPVLACRTSVADVAGRSVTTIEGLAAAGGGPHPVQRAIVDERASQCGYCVPGIALRAAALLADAPDPDDERIAAALSPSLCRCGTYPRLTRAVRRAASLARAGTAAGTEPDTTPGAAPPAISTNQAATAPGLSRPRRPWDLTPPLERDWFDILGDGLVAVWPPAGDRPALGGGARQGPGGAWVHVAPSGVVTAFSGKVDVGQDNGTAFRLLVAEELAVDPDRVRIVQGDTDLCPYDMGTFGSRSMPDAGQALRRAAAGAREALLSLAAHAGVPGTPAAPPAGTRQVTVLETQPPLTPPSAWRVAGRPGHAAARWDVVTGARRFVSDLHVDGARYGAVLRPPVPGAVLRTADTGPAEAMPGVTVVREGDFIGVAAPDVIAARRAVAAIDATWDLPAPGAADTAAFLRAHPTEGAGWQQPVRIASGDVDAALARADMTVSASYQAEYLAHVPLETRAALARWDGGRLTVWAGTNVPFAVRARLAAEFGVDQADVRVIVPATGGGFGGKHGEETVEAVRLARATGTPVKVHWSRAEEFTWGYLRPMAVIDVRAGLDADGTIVAWDLLDINAGAPGITFPYATASSLLRYQPAATPLEQGPYRALAATANTFARESALDELAAAAGLDPLRFRLDHLSDDRLAAVLRAAADRFGWTPDHTRAAGGDGAAPAAGGVPAAGDTGAGRRAASGVGIGWGVAAGMEKEGRVATCAEVEVAPDGAVRVTRLVTAYDCGAVVNPDTVVNQIEGGTVMALGGALFERVGLDHGRIASAKLADYRVPRFVDVPEIDVVLVHRPEIPPAGAGETPLIAVAPAIGNAIFAATGCRLRAMPLVPGGRVPGAGRSPG